MANNRISDEKYAECVRRGLVANARPSPAVGCNLILPMPPSTNHIWRIIRKRAIKSKEYNEWLAECMNIVADIGRVPSPVSFQMIIHGCRKNSDLDNRIKAVLDLLVHAGILEGDSVQHVQSLDVRYDPAKIDGQAVARIKVLRLEV
jgi:crossover junction endodeoxyribonuclease RusA